MQKGTAHFDNYSISWNKALKTDIIDNMTKYLLSVWIKEDHVLDNSFMFTNLIVSDMRKEILTDCGNLFFKFNGFRYEKSNFEGLRKLIFLYMLPKVKILWHFYLHYGIWTFACIFKPNQRYFE